MRLISFSVTISLVLLSSAALAQQFPTTSDSIGHPPPIPSPPPISEPSSTTQPAPAASTPRASEPAPKGRLYKNSESSPMQHSRSRD